MKRKTAIVVSSFLWICNLGVQAQSSLGKVTNYHVDGNTVTVNCDDGTLVVQNRSDYSWKVSSLPSGKTIADERKSITLLGADGENTQVRVADEHGKLRITHGNSTVIVDKSTALLSFEDNGTVRLTEKSGIDNTAAQKTVSFTPQNELSFYGGGYNGRWSNLNGKTLIMDNTQNYNWDQSFEKPNNICVPFIVSDKGYGLLFEDHYQGATILPDSKNGISYTSESPTPISYVYVGSEDGSMASVMQSYGEITGYHELPPYWALGYITSRYGYHSQQETEEVIEQLKRHDMPVSAVVLDLFWEGEKQNGMGNLDWYKPNWPDAPQMMDRFKSQGVHTVIITEPYFAEETVNYKPLLEQGLFADPACPNMTWVSDNKVGIIDFMNPKASEWMWQFYQARTDEGVDGWWLDLGEPEMITEGTIHADGSTHMQAHNEFGQKWIEGVWTNWKQTYPDQRPLFMPRSGTSGMQRYATYPWTGDIARSWSGLRCQVPAMVNAGMSGLGYLSSDIGGFVTETQYTDADLYLRWFQLGVFSPVLRTHGQYLPEPYQDEYASVESRIRDLMNLRYRMLPYNYSNAWANTTKGMPLTMPVNFYSQEDQQLVQSDDEYLFGPNYLVAPVMEPDAKGRTVYLPSGEWFDPAGNRMYNGNTSIDFESQDCALPYFIRRGSFTPLYSQTTFTSTDDIDNSRLDILYPMTDGEATSFTLYDDDKQSAIVGDRYELIKFDGKETAQSHVITMEQTCGETYEGRPSERTLTFDIPLCSKHVADVKADNAQIEGWSQDNGSKLLKVTAKLAADYTGNRTSTITIAYDNATGITSVSADNSKTGTTYNLGGQRTQQNVSGVTVTKGKKMVKIQH